MKKIVKETKSEKWNVKFEFQETQYTLLIDGVEEQEIEQIIQNLYFQMHLNNIQKKL